MSMDATIGAGERGALGRRPSPPSHRGDARWETPLAYVLAGAALGLTWAGFWALRLTGIA